MCTATWIRTDAGYVVFFNRDELRTRKPALPPKVMERDGVRFVAPQDGDAGGTWLGVNEFGVTIGLGNGPADEGGRATAEEKGPFRSRGLLVLDLLSSASVVEAGKRMEGIDPEAYRAFELFAIGPAGEARLWSSGGRGVTAREGPDEGALLISSSRDPARGRAERERLFERMLSERERLDERLLADFHASHEPQRGAFSPCMHREDASTVSESRIAVDERVVAFSYLPGPPCEAREDRSLVTKKIPRRLPA
jgi:uncharacterized protein with NRDE domain